MINEIEWEWIIMTNIKAIPIWEKTMLNKIFIAALMFHYHILLVPTFLEVWDYFYTLMMGHAFKPVASYGVACKILWPIYGGGSSILP